MIDVVGRSICRGGFLVRFSNKDRHMSFEIISLILFRHAAGKFLSRQEIYEILYGDDASGGPLFVSQVLSSQLIRNRHNLSKLGLAFRTIGKNRGFEITDLWEAAGVAA